MKIWMPTIRTDTGAEVWARRLAGGLAARGHAVGLMLLPHGMQYLPWAAPGPATQPDVTIANSWNAAAFAKPAPLLTVLHHVVHDPAMAAFKSLPQRIYHRNFILPMERAALRRSAATVTVSHHAARQIRDTFGEVACEVVPNGVDTDFFTPEKAGRGKGTFELLWVGKPSRRKAFEVVAQALEMLGKDFRLTVIGPPPEPGISVPVEARVLGRVSREQLRSAYRAADLLLFPSRLEGFGYAAAEAMACGTPVLCSAGGAVAEVVDPPANGIALPAGDSEAVCAAVRALAAQPERLAEMRENARNRAVSHFSETRWLDKMEDLLRRVVGTSRERQGNVSNSH
ncbi:glycosyltransferase family 4 protein [Sphingomonas sp.]|uniref:glycosyltransferase family 4 protein n=1 Tax=Sphingomonas sp. TaxID=28214 RepID=UPI0025EAD8B7|nr:glycosyltransferase family 4 protein [Sphingomonas sp.]